MQAKRMTMARALVEFLDQQYVSVDGKETPFMEGVATIFGHGSVLGIGQASEQDPGRLQVMQGCNEQEIAYMATGFAKQHHRQHIFAVTSSVGSGTANMMTAAVTATANRIPLLLLSGGIYACRRSDPVLQQIEQYHDPSISTNGCSRSVPHYWDHINRSKQSMNAMLSAIRALTDPTNIGAVTTCLLQNVQRETWDYPPSFSARQMYHAERRLPDPQRLTQARVLISRKHHPPMMCGGGVRYPGMREALREFVEVL